MRDIEYLIRNADDDALLMSRRNCHVKGLHSLVFKNDDGMLSRMFMTTPDHEMHENFNLETGDFSLGVHDHKYDLSLVGVKGRAVNLEFMRVEDDLVAMSDSPDEIRLPRPVKEKFLYRKHAYTSTNKMSEPIIINQGGRNLKLFAYENINRLFIRHTTLHTVYVPKGEKACWIVYEGKVEQETTNLYTNRPISETSGSYDLFDSAEDVKRFFMKHI